MSGYDGTHQDWLEGQASDQLEREDYERERRTNVVPIGGVQGEVAFAHSPGVLFVSVRQAGQRIASWSMDHDIAVNFAHAILAEVEIAQRAEFGGAGGMDG